MHVHDLDCFADLTHSADICGGSIADMILSLKIIDRQLSIALGGTMMFETMLPESPTGIQISIEDKPRMQTYASSLSIGSGLRHLSVFASQSDNGHSAYSFSSSSSRNFLF